MHDKQLSFYHPPAEVSVHVAQPTSCLDSNSPLQLTIIHPHAQPFCGHIPFRRLPCYPNANYSFPPWSSPAS